MALGIPHAARADWDTSSQRRWDMTWPHQALPQTLSHAISTQTLGMPRVGLAAERRPWGSLLPAQQGRSKTRPREGSGAERTTGGATGEPAGSGQEQLPELVTKLDFRESREGVSSLPTGAKRLRTRFEI